MEKYIDFINEAKKSDMGLGKYIYFNGNLKEYGVFGMFAKIVGVETGTKASYDLEFVGEKKPRGYTNYKYVDIENIKVTQNQIRNFVVIEPDVYDLISKGKLKMFESKNEFNALMGNIGFVIPKPCWLDICYINIDIENDDMFSYLPIQKIVDISQYDHYTSRLRQTMKIGKFFRKMDPKLKEKQVEELITKYKAAWTMQYKGGDIEIVEGEKIRYWYSYRNYNSVRQVGTLWASCMRQDDDQHRFNIYCENPDKVKMLIMTDPNKKLMARALVWNLDEPTGKILMDRIYSIDPKFERIMQEYGIKQGWSMYERNKSNKYKVKFNKDYGASSVAPYMDTFKYFCQDIKGGYYLSDDPHERFIKYTYTGH